MKSAFACCVLGVLSIGTFAVSRAAGPSDATVAAIIALEKEWSQAEADNTPNLIEPLLADQAVFTDGNGKVTNRAEFLAGESSTKFTSSTVEDVRVTVFGNTAIANYLLRQKGADKGGSFDRQIRETDTWVKMPTGTWQVVASHGTNLKKK